MHRLRFHASEKAPVAFYFTAALMNQVGNSPGVDYARYSPFLHERRVGGHAENGNLVAVLSFAIQAFLFQATLSAQINKSTHCSTPMNL